MKKLLSAENMVRFCKALFCLAVGLVIFALGASFMVWPSLRDALAQERIALTTPAFTDAGAQVVRITFMQLDWENQNLIIRVRAVDTNGVIIPTRNPVDFTYTDVAARNRLRIIDTNNFSSISMRRRGLVMLQNDGSLGSGTFSGSQE